MGTLSKLRTCNNDFEAQLLKGALKAEGIVCMLSNEYFTNLYGGMISSATGIDVSVAQQDINKATDIMNRTLDNDDLNLIADQSTQNVEWSFG